LRAAALGLGVETFVFEMREPLNIYELAIAHEAYWQAAAGRDIFNTFCRFGNEVKRSPITFGRLGTSYAYCDQGILVIAERHPFPIRVAR